MNKRTVIVSLLFLAAVPVALSAQAQEKTRAEVRQELIDAQRNGLNFVSETSYPDVAPVFQQQVDRQKQENSDSGMGAATAGTRDAGNAMKKTAPSDPSTCVGPVSYCNIFFGS